MKKHRYIAFSGGVESTTMCLLYGKGATAIFSDTVSKHRTESLKAYGNAIVHQIAIEFFKAIKIMYEKR